VNVEAVIEWRVLIQVDIIISVRSVVKLHALDIMTKLKSLRALGAFDGETSHADIPRDVPLPKCEHKAVRLVTGSELRCKCGAAWKGHNVIRLYELFTS